MSSDTHDGPASPPSPPTAATTAHEPEPRPRIKIGTQRPGVEAPRIEPRVKFVAPGKPQPKAPAQEPPPPSEPTPSPRQAPLPVPANVPIASPPATSATTGAP